MVEIREWHPLTSAWDVAYLLTTMLLVIFSCYLCLLFSNSRTLQNAIYSCNKHVLHLFLCICQWQWRQWSTKLPERNTNILLKIARESTYRRLINQLIWQSAAYWSRPCSSLLDKEERQYSKAINILLILANDVLQHFHHDQTQKKSQTYHWMNLFQSHVWDAGIRRRRLWKSITGTNS